MQHQLPGPRYPMHFPANPLQRAMNPEGAAAVGAVLGNLLGGGTGALLSIAFFKKPEAAVDIVIEDATPEEAQGVISKESEALLAEMRRWNRIRHALSGSMATLGAALGAYVGASPHQKQRAAIGAAIGTGAMRAINVAVNPVYGPPGLITGGIGAYIGAQGAR